MTLTDTTLHDIRTDLITGVDAHNRRRRSRRRILAVAPIVLLAAGAAIISTGGRGNPAYALTQAQDGTIRVEVYPDFDDVEALEASLADAGLDAVVVQLRSHPSLDGVIEVSSHNNESSGALEFDNGEFVIDIGAVEGEIEILIYSSAQDGERYQAAPSLFAPGQELGGLNCAYPDTPLSSAELERRANEAGITEIVWVVFEGTGPGATGSEDLAERPDGAVSGAQMRDATTMTAFVQTDLTEPAATTISMSSGAHFRDSPTCTPELAALWN